MPLVINRKIGQSIIVDHDTTITIKKGTDRGKIVLVVDGPAKIDRAEKVERPTTVINKRRNNESYDIYIGRGSMWGNPFRVVVDGTRKEIIEKHLQGLLRDPGLMRALPNLRGKVLGCFCKPLPCHGDNYVRLLNIYTDEELRCWAKDTEQIQ